MSLKEIIQKIIDTEPVAIMIVEETENEITSHIFGRINKEQFYDVLADAVAQHEIEKKKAFDKAWDEIKDRLPF